MKSPKSGSVLVYHKNYISHQRAEGVSFATTKIEIAKDFFLGGWGGIHKRCFLRGRGRRSPLKPIYYISLFSKLSQQGEGGGS